ncbi:MAG TPA: UbiA family prenyltransferase, partial [Streptosporangiaceae bacterium]|nr:UbiA family prenyltransferase [Streptosporangiaceae bacterium]
MSLRWDGAPWWPGWRVTAELVRLPAALSVPGDVLAGAAAGRWQSGRRTAGLVGSSVCLYWAGMALNDWADRDEDAEHRPWRPIPSGRVRARSALCLATILTGAGVGLAWLTGGRAALRSAGALATVVWAYDLGAKRTRAGPSVMAAARALNVLLGGGGMAAVVPAAAVAGHTVAVTAMSAHEVDGGPAARRVACAALAGTAAVTATAALAAVAGRIPPARPRAHGRAGRIAGAVLTAAYAADVGRAQLAAARDPAPAVVQRAVATGILGLIPLQGGLLAS